MRTSAQFAFMLGFSVCISSCPVAAATAVPPQLARIPVTNAPLPAFPYIQPPAELKRGDKNDKVQEFDSTNVLVGDKLHAVEGRVMRRKFYNASVNLSKVASLRNHANAIAALGGVQTDTVETDNITLKPGERASDARKSLGIDGVRIVYDSYVVRTPNKNIWFNVAATDLLTSLTVIEEKPMVQTVALVTAEAMRDALEREGRVALYINFDTDKASIRDDGKHAVDEITALLKKDPTLKLSIEGHTDNTGDAKRNKTLSQQRADAVMAAVTGAGIERSRLSAVGHGATKPLADNGNEEGRAKNRRVELVKTASR